MQIDHDWIICYFDKRERSLEARVGKAQELQHDCGPAHHAGSIHPAINIIVNNVPCSVLLYKRGRPFISVPVHMHIPSGLSGGVSALYKVPTFVRGEAVVGLVDEASTI